VVVYDQLGSGRSGRPLDQKLWTVDRFESEIVSLRKALDLKEIHLLGHSWGAALAAQYLIAGRPPGIKSVVLSEDAAKESARLFWKYFASNDATS
jgi:proline iminopeptidase